MTQAKRPLKVFLSYASQDTLVVQELSRRLVGEGWIDPWVDKKKLLPGQDWRTKIEEAVETSDIVIICLSTNSVTKEGFVQKELRYAREIAFEKPEETIFLVPLRLDDCSVPRGLRFYQWGDYFGEKKEGTYSALLESLKLRYEQKLDLEEKERVRREKERQERETAEKIAREEAEREAAEKAKREKAEREITERIAREKAEHEAVEKARLEAEEKAKQKDARGKAEREAIEKTAKERAERESAEKAAREQAKRESVEKTAREKAEREATHEQNVSNNNEIAPKASHELPIKRNTKLPAFLFGTTGIFIAIVVCVVGVMVFSLMNQPRGPSAPINTVPTTVNFVPTSTESVFSNSVPTDSATSISNNLVSTNIVPTSKPSLSTEITDAQGVQMVLVPAGNFIMGSDNGDANEKPAHRVYLDSFYIDKYEVTTTHYIDCLNANMCLPPQTTVECDGCLTNYFYPSNRPVIYVDWGMATAYCKWRDAQLPTEAEWEKAARGTDGRIYPWGDKIDRDHAYYDVTMPGPMSVGSFESGKSVYGVYDMAGNVWEWVADWYGENYYTTLGNDVSNPMGPQDGMYRVLKGGSFSSNGYYVRSAVRLRRGQAFAYQDIGFRCARDATP